MKIVILGYTGLIGSSILKNFAKYNSLSIICVARSIRYKPLKNSKVKYIKWDFASFNKSSLSFLKKTNIIINCVGKIYSDEKKLEDINVIFLKNLLRYLNSNNSEVRLIHLSSVSVYGNSRNYLGERKIINEKTSKKTDNFYSKSKLKGDSLIQNVIKRNLNRNFSYTILRISNVFGENEKSNLIKFIIISLKYGFWIRCSKDIIFNFINVKDINQVINLVILNLKKSKNKIYIVSDDCKQAELYQSYQNYNNKKIFKINIPVNFLKFLLFFFPLPKKVVNLFLVISNRVSYSNKKIKKELNFNAKYSLYKKFKIFK